jgi:type IV pilus assembly protein PilW
MTMNTSTQSFPSPLHRHPATARRQGGLSLVELMISNTIGLLLLAGITTLLVQQSNTRSELEKSSRQIENGRYAMQILHDDIRHAGFYGQFANLAESPYNTLPSTLPDPCATAFANPEPSMTLPIQGYDAPATVPAPLSACLTNANHVAGTDILVIRRADTTETPIASRAAGQVYLQTTAVAYVLGAATGSETQAAPGVFTLKMKDGTTAATLRKYHVHIYFVSPCSQPTGGGTTCTGSTDDNGRPIPTLKRLELTVVGGATAFSVAPLVEGIDNLQLDYGIDTTGDGSPDSYVTAPASTADWANVMTVRVNLLARNNDPTTGHQDTKTYSLGMAGSTGPFNDTYKRHAYSGLVRAINPSGRREQ